MAYTVFARKYRPQTFGDVLGQEAVAHTLRSAIANDRAAHAYLLCGPRGTGKTSLARIAAKALNCAQPAQGEPCNTCPACTTITAGTNFDVDEFDAASNRKVEDAEALTERVRAPRPARADSRCKIFIVDEVHMMTKHAFNALLKTLEEPPAHVKFIFCTTEPDHVPDTITSRCQRFDFRPITTAVISAHLATICQQEGVTAEPAALELVAYRARGGMRDAQSLLDQAVTLACADDPQGGGLTRNRLEQTLGLAPRQLVLDLLQAIADEDSAQALSHIDCAYRGGIDMEELAGELTDAMRECMVTAHVEHAQAEALSRWHSDFEILAAIASKLGRPATLFALAELCALEQRLRTARNARVWVELTCIKLTQAANLVSLPAALRQLRSAAADTTVAPAARPQPQPAAAPNHRPSGPAAVSAPASRPSQQPQAPQPTQSPPPPLPEAWSRTIEVLRQSSPTVASALDGAGIERQADDSIAICFGSKFARDRIFSRPQNKDSLQQALSAQLGGAPITLAASVATEQVPQPSSKDPSTTAPPPADPNVARVLGHSQGGSIVGMQKQVPSEYNR